MIHNPENVESPGEGYRFLTVEERLKRAGKSMTRNIHAWQRMSERWQRMAYGSLEDVTYRTKLTPEELEAEG